MRYRNCTLEDIKFLRSCITSEQPDKPSITDSTFRFVSIITAKISQKDEINYLGCQKFAQETEQELTDFFSHDALKSSDYKNHPTKYKKAKTKVTKLRESLQKLL